MPDSDRQNRPHFVLKNNSVSEIFKSHGRGGNGESAPHRDRQSHGRGLVTKLQQLEPVFSSAVQLQRDAGLDEAGLQIEFASFPDVKLAFESLAREASGIELLNVRSVGNQVFATVFVPEGKLTHFERLVSSYLEEDKDTTNGPRNSKLLNAISDIRAATLQALWTDTVDSMPVDDEEIFWWEVWLPVKKNRAAVVMWFRELAYGLELRVADGQLEFPERTVLLVLATAGRIKQSMTVLNMVAEFRRAKETADFFDSLPPVDQTEWVDDLVDRLSVPGAGSDVPHVCLLDTGVNNTHSLLSGLLSDADRHTVEPGWGVNDAEGHGTEMAGLAVFGNLTDALSGTQAIQPVHRLESVKLIPDASTNNNDATHHGYLTVEAVQRPLSDRKRVYSMAVTALDNRDSGRPSAWSAAVDRITSDADAQGEDPKLMIVSAGNIDDSNAWGEYPISNADESVHDPAQAWNALTVGAMTELVNITEADTIAYQPIAETGGLSPFSTTSNKWHTHWPLKPDVVFEGGNAANDGLGAVTMPSLQLLTTNSNTVDRLFTTTNATSAASALAAKMAAELMAQYPDLWPETIRGLMVHSAGWSENMKRMFLPRGGKPRKTDYLRLVRHCGFGIPDLQRALWSVDNSLTVVCEETLHPFQREGSNQPKFNEMNIHALPWPLAELEALGEAEVEMRVTLSYYIEPNPSARGVTSRYRYESHGLRFDVKRPLESENVFRARLNAAAVDDDTPSKSSGSDDAWIIGKNNRHRGSIHSDIWCSTATELASRGLVGIYPSSGWWRSRQNLRRYDLSVRYSLIVSISAPEVDVDLYTAVANKIGVAVEVS